MSANEKIAALKAIQRTTARLVGSHAKALDQMASAAPAVAAALSRLGVTEALVRAFVADQRCNINVYSRGAA